MVLTRIAERVRRPRARETAQRLARENDELRYQVGFSTDRRRETIDELAACAADLGLFSLDESPRRSELLANLLGTTVSEALYIVATLSARLQRPGAVAEFGVAQGATSALIANEIRETDKELWLFDSFEGLPPPTEEDVLIDDIFNLGSMEAYAGTMASPAEEVKSRLREIDFPPERTHIVPGFIENTLTGPGMPEQFAFAYIDLDFYLPIKTVLQVMLERLVPGGALIVDDYGHFSEGAQRAVDEFVAEHGESFEFSLPRPWAGHFAILERG